MSGRFFRCLGFFTFTLQIATKRGADERTRTAYPCSLRVIGPVLLGFAEGCKSRISKRLSLLRVAACCTVLRSRWCQSGVNFRIVFAFDVAFYLAGTHFVTAEFVLTSVH